MAFPLEKLTPRGRIGRKAYWIGSVILLGVEVAVMFAPGYVAGEAVYALLLYPWIWLYARRLHDLGLSGWVQLLSYVVVLPVMIGGWSLAYREIVDGLAAAQAQEERQMLSTLYMAVFGFGAVANLAFFLWLGIARGQPRPNRHGPEPGAPPIDEVFS